jgi:hypothetical protein
MFSLSRERVQNYKVLVYQQRFSEFFSGEAVKIRSFGQGGCFFVYLQQLDVFPEILTI